MLVRTAGHMQKGLKALEEYCNLNELVVNTSKTKVLRVSASGKCRKKCPAFKFNGETIEVVKSYTYLGVLFTPSVVGLSTVNHAINRSKVATSTALATLAKLKADSWSGKIKLYNSLVRSTLLYQAHLWCIGSDYIEMLESAHIDFFKKLLTLPKCTPGYAIRIELNIEHSAVTLLQASINWTIKILKLEDHRLPKICLLQLLKHQKSTIRPKMLCWSQHLYDTLKTIGEEQLLDSTDSDLWAGRKEIILSKYRRHLALADRDRYARSQACQVILPTPLFEILPEMSIRIPQHLIKPIVQLRLASNYSCFISIANETIYLSPVKTCVFCGSGCKETILHFLVQCTFYANLRSVYWENDNRSCSDYETLGKMLGVINKPNLRTLLENLQSCLILRKSFI
ncbi:Protein of unknown function [Cotesia congregata]|uniref:Uncharacterized protein n=1 Tax=Cotesia congregata TaxID=51543 RepID=A0A8J2ECP2_COTCN|nr:Protein of unknown function [Cotesia congregata]